MQLFLYHIRRYMHIHACISLSTLVPNSRIVGLTLKWQPNFSHFKTHFKISFILQKLADKQF